MKKGSPERVMPAHPARCGLTFVKRARVGKRRPFTIVADRVGYEDDQSPSRRAAPYRDRDVDESAQPRRDSGPEPPDGSIDPSN